MQPVHLHHEYAPWSAEFVDGTYASRLIDRTLTFASLAPKLSLLYTFYIHFDHEKIVAVRLTDGLFYRGPKPGDPCGWFPGPVSFDVGHKDLIYSRQCGGSFAGGKVESAVLGYTLGWRCGAASCLMCLDLNGNFVWAP